ncbi:MAG: VIT and VWA domain-containing protein [Syntrophaceae bacterium]
METRARKVIPFFLILIAVFFSSVVHAEQSNNKTLSPYFFISNGDASVDYFPLKETNVVVNISGVIADVVITQKYANEGSKPINARYVFPASTQAAVHGMKMRIGDHVITAKIKERQAALQAFETAKKEGKSAALLNQERPNVFTMNVANIMPGDTVDVELRYTELLIPTDGTYEFVYPTVVGPRYSNSPEANAPETDKWVKSPYLKKGKEVKTKFNIAVNISAGIPVEDVFCTSHSTKIAWPTKSIAQVALDQAEKNAGNRDFILKYRLTGKQIRSGLMLYTGKDENFFLLMVQPPQTVKQADIPPREYIFVVDVSGSMHGFPLEISKNLLRNLIGKLRPIDTFNVVLFSGGSYVMAQTSVPATQENVDTAIQLIGRQTGGGGTELCAALQKAMSLPYESGYSRSIIIATDGYIAAEKEALHLIRKNLNNANVFSFGIGSSVNRYLIEGIAAAGQGEPFIVTKAEEAENIADKFRQYIQSPVLTGISVQYDGFKAYDVEPASIPDVFAQRPVIIFGKWDRQAQGTITLSGISGSRKYSQTFKVADIEPLDINAPLRYLWARKKIASLSDFNFQQTDNANQTEITNLGLKYNLLTPYTSFIAVHEVVRNTEANSKDITQPLPLPAGVSELAVGGGVMNTPEPEFYLVLTILAGIIFFTAIRTRRKMQQTL